MRCKRWCKVLESCDGDGGCAEDREKSRRENWKRRSMNDW